MSRPEPPVDPTSGTSRPEVRPRPGDRRPVAETVPGHGPPRPVAQAVGGAALSVAGVVLGIAVLLWATDAPPAAIPAGEVAAAAPAPGTPPGSSPAEAPVASPPPAAGRTAPAPDSPSGSVAVVPLAPSAAAPSPAAPSAAAPPAAAPPAAAPPAAAPSPLRPVTVLNNSRRDGLAARAAARFRARGWPVAHTGNFRGRIRVTTVYYDPGLEASARAFADAQDIARVRPRFAGLPATGVVVVVTREFAA